MQHIMQSIVVVILLSVIIFIISPFSYAVPAKHDFFFNKAMQEIALNDDLDYDSLKTSVERSISYYRKLPDSTIIRYPNRSFTKNEMISALRRFTEICRMYRGTTRTRSLNSEFDILAPSRYNRIIFTGYYEESVKGSLYRTAHFNAPVYSRPNDLVTADFLPYADLGLITNGKIAGNRLIRYDTREQISTFNSLEGRASIICFVNKIDLFFMQIEGSALIELPGGTAFRVMYDGDNGRDYVSIASALKMQNLTKSNLIRYFRHNSREIDRIFNVNPRYVFFKYFVSNAEGSLGEALVPGRSVAADPDIYPRGAVAYIHVGGSRARKSEQAIRRFVCIQDAGSAIKGINRIDIYFGDNQQQLFDAEKFKRSGNLFLIVPKKRRQKSQANHNERKQASASFVITPLYKGITPKDKNPQNI